MTNSIPLALYIHIPWCEKKCPYCDFNSHQAKDVIDEAAYINTLLRDLDNDLSIFSEQLAGRQLSSIFIGGGTPSLFSAKSITDLLHGVKTRIDCSDNIEISCEANPGSSEVEKFAGIKDGGVTRLSIGVQSFKQAHLKSLGRVHSSNEALNAATAAREAGFDNFNLDLMFGLPEQSLEAAIADVAQAIDLASTHLSCYQLTIEPNTLFHHSPPITPDHDTLWDMQSAIQEKLANAHFQQYEVSAYSQKGRRCRHNTNYWEFGDYLGIGAGAHGKITGQDCAIQRTWKIKHPSTYMSNENPMGGIDVIEPEQKTFEFMLNAIRLTNGFSLDLFTQRTGLPVSSLEPILNKHLTQGLIAINQTHFLPTERGKQFLDSMLEDYLTVQV